MNNLYNISYRLINVVPGVNVYLHSTSLENNQDVEAEFIKMIETALPQVDGKVWVISVVSLNNPN